MPTTGPRDAILIKPPAAVLALVLGTLAYGAIFCRRLPRGFRHRTCQGAAWRRAFPEAAKDEIRAFMSIFMDAFAIRRSEQLKLGPGDRILDVYRARYPSRLLPDDLELEIFARDLRRQFGLELESIWREQITIGDVFKAICRPAAS